MSSLYENFTESATLVAEKRPVGWQTWGIGLLVVTITAFGPSICITIVPCLNKTLYKYFMTFLVALGIGTLSGSTLYVLLPGAFNLNDKEDNDYIIKTSILIAALYIFFSVDRILAYLVHFRKMRSKGQKIHQSSLNKVLKTDKNAHDTTAGDNAAVVVPRIVLLSGSEGANTDDGDTQEFFELDKNRLKSEFEAAVMSNALSRKFSSRRHSAVITVLDSDKSKVLAAGADDNEAERKSTVISMDQLWNRAPSKKKVSKQTPMAGAVPRRTQVGDEISVNVEVVEEQVLDPSTLDVATVAWMIMFGSSANNFVDGMSNGAAFAQSFSRGLSVGIAVIAQQLPQEIGTLAILIQSGLGFKRTLLLSLVPNMLSYLGFIIGVVIGNAGDSYSSYVFAISSGMYLYIFLGTLIPEIRDTVNEQIKIDLKGSVRSTVLQAVGIATGVVFMFVMCRYGRAIQLPS